MRLTALLFLLVAPLAAGDARVMTWSELSETVQANWTVRVSLPDGTAVEGNSVQFQADALTMQVNHTSNKSMHSKGPISVPRSQVRILGIRKERHRGRTIGTLVPIGAGIGIAIGVYASSRDAFLGDVTAAAGAVLGAAVAVVGGTVGYFIGRRADRRFETVAVTP